MKKYLITCTIATYFLLPLFAYANGNVTVWVTPKGDRYHKTSTCQDNASPVTLKEAVEKWERTPCQKCRPPEYNPESYKEHDDKLIQSQKEETDKYREQVTKENNEEHSKIYSQKALNDLENGTYRQQPTPTPNVEEPEKTSSDVKTIAIAAVAGSGAALLTGKLKRK